MPLKPPKYVCTVRRLIYWQYSQLIAKAAGFDGNYGFVVSRYKKLESGEISWSSSIRDYEKELEKGRVCLREGTGKGKGVCLLRCQRESEHRSHHSKIKSWC